MRASVSGLFAALSLLLLGCAPGTAAREDRLWREYTARGPSQTDGAALFAGDEHLERQALIEAVLARNPSVNAAREALRAALAQIPQMTALDDPTLSYELAPLSVAGDAPLGHVVSIRQRLPFPGKRRLAGEAALAMAEAEGAELEMVQLELAEMASEMYDEYFVTARALEINAQHRILLEQMKKSAEVQYVAGRAAQQDPIQAEVELAQLERERIMLDAERDQIIARVNGLIHRMPTAALPPPPAELALASVPAGTSAELQEQALRKRPQRKASNARIRAAHARRASAQRDYYPDFELMGSYNSMWDMAPHRWMVGVMVDVPIQREKRPAAVEQADAEIARAGFEDERIVDDIRVEVDRAARRVTEAQALVEVHVNKLLPAARAQVDSARVGFTAAQNSFLAVVQSQKNLRDIELSLARTRAELSRRRAALSRVVGVIPGLPDGGSR